MIFKVSTKLKGSCALSTLNKVISAGMTISIEENDLYEPDIKVAIKKGILIPVNKKYTEKMSKTDPDVVIINKTNKVIVLGNIVLKPKSSLLISKIEKNSHSIQSALENGLIRIISDENKKVSKVVKKKIVVDEEKEVVDYVAPKSGEDRDVKPVVWDCRSQSLKEAQKVPKMDDVVRVDEADDAEEAEFVDTPKKKVAKKKIAKKKISKKKTATKKKSTKKEETTKKKRKVKTLEPVGDKKIPKTSFDAAMELDSRGNPIGDKPSDTLKHLIDEASASEEINFADQDQAKERYNNRNDIE